MNNASNLDIPEEIQVEILSWLPPKSLSRFKCVSKHWNTTLTMQAFLVSHSRSYDTHSKLAFVALSSFGGSNSVLSFELNDDYTPKTTIVTVTIPPRWTVTDGTNSFTRTRATRSKEVVIRAHNVFSDFLSKYNSMSNICNDLSCLFNFYSTEVGLINLKTLDFINLPQVTTKSIGVTRYALGFDPVLKVFKVLNINFERSSSSPNVAILTLGSEHWRTIEYRCLPRAVDMNYLPKGSENSFCLDGVIYWVDKNEMNIGDSLLTVVAFDLNGEVFREYKFDTITIKVDERIRYYLTSLNGNPTLFIWKAESDEIEQFWQAKNDEIEQFTLFNHKNPKGSWTWKSFIGQDFPTDSPYGGGYSLIAGGSILLHSVKPVKYFLKPEEQDNPLFSWYTWYDLENFAFNPMELNVEQKIEDGFKRRNCNTSGTSFADLSEDLQINILSRLPPKIFSRCKFVSKHWNAILTIQTFMFRHARSYDKLSKVAFVVHTPIRGSNTVLSFELSDNKNPNTTTITVPKTTKIRVRNNMTTEVIKGHHECFQDGLWRKHECNVMSNICNDLICLFNRFPKRVGLLSLRTEEFITLPAVPTECAGRITLWYALGFDPVSNLYKVLSIYGGSEECCTKAAIFTIGSKHWEPVEFKFSSFTVTLKSRYWNCQNRFCLDGVIYWVNDNEIDNTSVLTVVAFDLNREVFTDYKLDTIPIKDVKEIKYYLTSLKGRPTLFIWNKESDEIQQLTLFNHENPNVSWNRRSFIAHDFPKKFSYGCCSNCVAGGSILLHSVKPVKNSIKPEERYNELLSWYIWYDLEKFAME